MVTVPYLGVTVVLGGWIDVECEGISHLSCRTRIFYLIISGMNDGYILC